MPEHARSDVQAQDEAARRTAQTCFDRPLVLEAGAGTGKTAALTARIVAWSLGPGWAEAETRSTKDLIARDESPDSRDDRNAARVLDEVVAITFTEAAAAEMAARVGEFLTALERGEVPTGLYADLLPASVDERRRRARSLLGSLNHLSVMTIHAFCLRILLENPLAAGVHPGFTIDADGLRREELIREVIEDRVAGIYASRSEDLLTLAAAGCGLQEIADLLSTLVEYDVRPEALDQDPFAPEAVEEICRDLQAALQDVLAAAGVSDRLRKRPGPVQEVMENLERLRRHLEETPEYNASTMQALCSLIQRIWTKRSLERLKAWGRGRFTKSETDCLDDGAARLAAAAGELEDLVDHLRHVDPEFLARLRRCIVPLLSAVRQILQARGVVTFNSLLRTVRDLLLQKPHVGTRLRRRIKQLLVDEFQDTEPLQCEIIRMIALGTCKQERPSLFIVGDPKQSIYGWRNADLRAYEAFVGELLQEGGKRCRLSVNFRSTPLILKEVDRVIRPVMQRRPGLQPAYQRLVPSDHLVGDPGFATDRWSPIEYWVSWPWDDEKKAFRSQASSRELAELEARALARDILDLHRERGVLWREIGVLFRNTGDLDIYLQAFRRSGVPYAVTRDRSYYRRREIIEVAALVRTVLDPNDHLALLTLMRSVLVGVPDAALIPLWSREFPALVTELYGGSPRLMKPLQAAVGGARDAMPTDIPGLEMLAGWEENLLCSLQSLGILRESFHKDPADTFVERLRRLFLVEPTEAAMYLGAFRMANLDRFFRNLLAAMDDGGGDPQAVLRTLRAGVAEVREAEEGRPKEAAENAVQVMTVHKAKGLDFQHVYVVQLHKAAGNQGSAETRAEMRNGRLEYCLIGRATPGFHYLERQRNAVAAAEAVRTLYVAMTRAKGRLVLMGCWPAHPDCSSPTARATYMDLLQQRDSAFRPPADPTHAARGCRRTLLLDPEGVGWKFPGGGDLDYATEAMPGVNLESAFTAERVGERAQRIRTRREQARIRQNRPFRGAASEEAHRRLEELLGRHLPATRGESATGPGSPDETMTGDREVALAVGTAVHRALETLDLYGDPACELERQKERLSLYVRPLVAPELLDRTVTRSRALLERLSRGRLFERLFALREQVMARELPLYVPAESDGDGVVGFVAGAVDMVYRDAGAGRIVAVDYKTDQVTTPEEIAERTRVYADQGRVYVEALHRALALEQQPRFELWFLQADRMEALSFS